MEAKVAELTLSGHSEAESATTGFMHKTEGKLLGGYVKIDWLMIGSMSR